MSLRRRRPSGGTGGFTLVELMVVIAIIGMLSAIVGVGVMKHLVDARRGTARVEIKQIDNGIKLYKIDPKNRSRYPQSLNDLFANGGGYLEGRTSVDELVDPWGRPYVYTPPTGSSSYDIASYGLDGAPGGSEESADIHLKDALVPSSS